MSSTTIYGALPTASSGPYHYLYRITNLVKNKHYYGIRTSKNTLPQQDLGVKYFSSSRDKHFIKDQKEHPENYRYKVVITSDSRERIAELEIKLHNKFNVSANPNFYNLAIHTSLWFSYYCHGKVATRDSNGNCSLVPVSDPRIASGEIKYISKDCKWIYNPDLKKSIRLKPDESLPEGWYYGRKFYKNGISIVPLQDYKWIYNPQTKQNSRIKPDTPLPEGWIYGKKEKISYLFIHNPELKQNKRIKSDEQLPEGWIYGEKSFISKKKWVYNEELKQSLMINEDEPIPEGWFLGRKNSLSNKWTPTNKGYKWIHNKESNENIMIRDDEELPEGFLYGMYKVKSGIGNRWINNPELKKNIMLKSNEELPEGWIYGRKKFLDSEKPPIAKGSKYIFNLELQKTMLLKPGEELPPGWEYGIKKFNTKNNT